LFSAIHQLTFEERASGKTRFSAGAHIIIFERERKAGTPSPQVYLLNLGNGELHRVFPGPGPAGRRRQEIRRHDVSLVGATVNANLDHGPIGCLFTIIRGYAPPRTDIIAKAEPSLIDSHQFAKPQIRDALGAFSHPEIGPLEVGVGEEILLCAVPPNASRLDDIDLFGYLARETQVLLG
jgi:hypothetical protein